MIYPVIDLSKVAVRDRHSPYSLMPMDKAVSVVMEHANHLSTHLIDIQGISYHFVFPLLDELEYCSNPLCGLPVLLKT